MPNLHDLDRRISSVTSTKQITRTMQMIAGAKVRVANERVEAATPYAESTQEMLKSVASRASGVQNALLSTHDEIKNVLIVVIASDRGLAGGFNSNVLRRADILMRDRKAAGATVSLITCGKKAIGYYNYRKLDSVLSFAELSADPTFDEAASITAYAIDGYTNGTIDEVLLVYNHAKNAMTQIVCDETILPVDASNFTEDKTASADEEADAAKGETTLEGDVIFEPSAEGVLDHLLPAYIRTMIYHALIDSAAGEQAARRAAMMAATDNATEMIETLSRQYNRVRQGAITTEITEIVGGAAALED